MNRREAIQGAGSFTIPAALVIGGSALTLALTHAGHYPYAAARPSPVVTVTTHPPATSAAHPSPGKRRRRTGSRTVPQPGITTAPGPVFVAEEPAYPTGTSPSDENRPAEPSSPSPEPPIVGSPGIDVHASAAAPLGVLPDAGVDLTIGSGR